MSGTKRTPIGRPSRHPLISNEALALFAELERTPRRQRSNKVWKDAEHELARRLGLTAEWWAGCSVLDDSKAPCWPPWVAAHGYWHEVRAIREQLLAAVEKMQAAE